jgi:hypothetical protein
MKFLARQWMPSSPRIRDPREVTMGDARAALEALRHKDGGLSAELSTERASSLGRAGRKLDATIAACHAALAADALDAFRAARERRQC